jgi:sigma-B regulation protein RsbU (phosphoserine phosphatase)
MSLRDELLLAMSGSAIFTVGLLSLCAYFASVLVRERILLWFGLFAAPYGLALVLHSTLNPVPDSPAELLLIVLRRLIGLAAIVPALLLFHEFYGKGWRLSSKWVTWIYVLAAVYVLVLLGMRERAYAIPSPGMALVILVPLELVVDRIAGYRPPPIQHRPVIFAGLAVFFLTFAYDHISQLWLGNMRTTLEPLGFVILTICLGYVVSRRVAANQAEWIYMADEMRAARRIQAALLPPSMPSSAGVSVSARYAPVTAVAGDFYGFPRSGHQWMDIIVADVVGHGVPAALVASMVKVSVFSVSQDRTCPHESIAVLNTVLCEQVSGQYATAVYMSLRGDLGVGWYSSAGHPPPLLWRRRSQTLESLDEGGLLLGVRKGEPFTAKQFQFEQGDRLLVYSDGLTEAENAAGLSFGDLRLPELFASQQSCTAEKFADSLLQDVLAWSEKDSGPGQTDDITFVVVDLG